MSTDVIATFEDSLSELATTERTTADAFLETLSDHVVPPALGVSLPFDGVSLPDGIGPPEFPEDLREVHTGITPAGMGIANYGTVTVRSRAEGDELVGLYPEHHVVVVPESDVYPDMQAAFEQLGEEFDRGPTTQVLETGPSATADMGELVEGVHGPREVTVLILEGR